MASDIFITIGDALRWHIVMVEEIREKVGRKEKAVFIMIREERGELLVVD